MKDYNHYGTCDQAFLCNHDIIPSRAEQANTYRQATSNNGMGNTQAVMADKLFAFGVRPETLPKACTVHFSMHYPTKHLVKGQDYGVAAGLQAFRLAVKHEALTRNMVIVADGDICVEPETTIAQPQQATQASKTPS